MTTTTMKKNRVIVQHAIKVTDKVITVKQLSLESLQYKSANRNIIKYFALFYGLSKHIFLIISGIIMAFPFLWMISGALKSNDEIFSSPLNLIPEEFHWLTFVETFYSAPFELYIFNSFNVALFTTLIVIMNSAMFAYSLTQLKYRSKNIIYFIVMGCYMLPGAVTYIPSYIILAKLGLLNSHVGLVISNAVSIFGVFYLRQVFIKIHQSLIEAARIDGAGEFKILWMIILPQCRAAISTLFLITFITNYNSYMWPK